MRKRIFSVLTICMVIMSMSLSAFAHGERTDSIAQIYRIE